MMTFLSPVESIIKSLYRLGGYASNIEVSMSQYPIRNESPVELTEFSLDTVFNDFNLDEDHLLRTIYDIGQVRVGYRVIQGVFHFRGDELYPAVDELVNSLSY